MDFLVKLWLVWLDSWNFKRAKLRGIKKSKLLLEDLTIFVMSKRRKSDAHESIQNSGFCCVRHLTHSKVNGQLFLVEYLCRVPEETKVLCVMHRECKNYTIKVNIRS